MAQSPQQFPWLNEVKDSPKGGHDFLDRMKGIEDMAKELVEELIVLRRDIAAAKKRRKTG